MNGKLLAAALVAGTLAATPILAQQQPPGTAAAPPAQSDGGQQAAGPHPMMEHGMMGAEGMPGHGMMGRGMMGMMRPEMMRHMMMMRRSPREWCIDRLARRAGHLAALRIRLDLTPQQQPLWDKLQSVATGAEEKARSLCNELPPRGDSTILDRINWRERLLSMKLASVQAAKPAMAALYQALTPQQRELLDHPHRHW